MRTASVSPAAVANETEPGYEAPVVFLGEHDLPAFCPNKAMPLWNHHPRVFLDVSKTGGAKCPYCGTEYRLKPGTVLHGH